MRLYLEGHAERYALEQLQMSLFPDETMEFCAAPFSGDGTVSTLRRLGGVIEAEGRVRLRGRDVSGVCRMAAADETVPSRRRLLQRAFYLAAVQVLDKAPAWGALAGVRPTKLTTRAMLAGASEAACEAMLRDEYFVAPERRRLCLDASRASVESAALLAPYDLSLYIGIPFCPTRCAYCSFVSQSVEREGALLAPFLDALAREIEAAGRLLAATPYRVRTVYIGGGTPTTLSARQLERLLGAISSHFDLGRALEYTVEAGRPDTLDREKLAVLRAGGADRISINPQTMRDEVLRRMGRRHTAAQTKEAFALAAEAGFGAVNMDLIAGLPGDSVEGFCQSLDECIALRPANLTVHTLALKRGSSLRQDRRGLLSAEAVGEMLTRGGAALRAAGYAPYYLYRQKYMSGSFENAGWTEPGKTGYYNVYMMEELHSVLALGGGGVSKLRLPGGKILRLHNPKYPREYLRQFDSVLEGRRLFFEKTANTK